MIHLLNNPEEFFSALQKRFSVPLPGETAQNLMTSRARIPTEKYLEKNPNHRTSAVLLPLFPHAGTIYTALIRRPAYDGMHSGQLALPGGKVEERDVSLKQTAIRETEEEVGVKIPTENVFGELSPVYIPVSNFLVHPFIGKINSKPDWVPDKHEVDEVIEFPLTDLLDQSLKDRRRILIGKNMFIDAPCYIIKGQILWGATAMIFSELESLLRGN
ncbi:MAG TPA: CoA pyrophosphatase [Bacteroidia bacterium]|nr:CoA pyrophosphatase [Bacteroidia bacterium]